MRAGTFNIEDYLNKLYEAAGEADDKEEKKDDKKEEKEEKKEDGDKEEKKDDKEEGDKKEEPKPKSESKPSASKSTPASPVKASTPDTGNVNASKAATGNVEEEGITMPAENKKFYSWLKGEYQKGKTEVKVEMKMGDSKFEPGYDMQTNLDSVKDFKPGMFGEVKTGDSGKTNMQKSNNNQVTGLAGQPAQGQGQQLQKSKAMTVKSEPSKPVAGGQGNPAKAKVGEKPATPAAPQNAAPKPEPEGGKDAEIEKIDIKTKKAKDA